MENTSYFIKDYFGDNVYKPAQSNIKSYSHVVKSNIVLNPSASWVDKINQLTQDDHVESL